MSEEKMEMSRLDPRMPKSYKGYDVDNIIGKIDKQIQLTKEEEDILSELHSIYYPIKKAERPFPANAKVNLWGTGCTFIERYQHQKFSMQTMKTISQRL